MHLILLKMLQIMPYKDKISQIYHLVYLQLNKQIPYLFWRIYENSIQSHLSAVNFVMRGIFLSDSVKSFLNAEKYVIISKYYLGNIHCYQTILIFMHC